MDDKWDKVEAAIVSIYKPRNMNKINFAMYQHDALTLIDPELARLDKRDPSGKTLLMLAISFGRKDFVKKLIEQGANINAVDKLGGTALMNAAMGGNINITRDLIKAGANVNAIGERTSTALMYAAMGGHAQVAQELISAGADATMIDNKYRNALMYAAEKGHVQVAKVLIRALTGAPVEEVAESVNRSRIPSRIRHRTRRSLPSLTRRTRSAKN